MTEIDSETFFDCSSLNNVVIPDSVVSIDYEAFYGCSSLKSIVIPDSVTSIGNSVFYNCSSLTEITIPAGVKSLGSGIFSGCSSLKNLTVAKDNPIYHSDGNCIIETETKTLKAGLENSVIPSDGSVTVIGDSAFEGCEKLKSVVIPEGVEKIGFSAFEDCGDLASVEMHDGLKSIGGSAFSGCGSLTSITIPDSVTSIGGYAFYRCSSLNNVVIPDSVASIDSVFPECSSLTDLTLGNGLIYFYESFYSTPVEFNYYDNAKYLGTKDNPYFALIKYTSQDITSCKVHSDTKLIAKNAFGYMVSFGACGSLESVDLPEGLISICDYAFSSCSSLSDAVIPGSVRYIGDYAFHGCNLTSVKIGDDIKEIGGRAFDDDIEGNIYGGVKYLGNDANPYLVLFGPENRDITSAEIRPDAKLHMKESLAGCESLTNVIVPSGVTSIAYGEFARCSSLAGIELPETVESIGPEAFWGCTSLESLKIPSKVDKIDYRTFCECNSLTSIEIPDGVTEIGIYSFRGCDNLTSITIPYSVINIDRAAFLDCPALTDVYYGGTEAQWDAVSVEYGNEDLLKANIHFNESIHNEHRWDEGHITLPASYTEDGVMTYTCAVCGETRTEPIPHLISDIMGDVDGNGEISMKDVLLMRHVIAGAGEIGPDYTKNSDLDADGNITMKDVLKLRKIIAGVG